MKPYDRDDYDWTGIDPNWTGPHPDWGTPEECDAVWLKSHRELIADLPKKYRRQARMALEAELEHRGARV